MSARDGIRNYLIGRAVCRTPRPVDEAEGLLDAYRAQVIAAFVDRVAAELSGCCTECESCIDIMRVLADEQRRPLRPDDVETGDGR